MNTSPIRLGWRSIWAPYVIPLLLGGSFVVTLLHLSWDTVLNEERQAFSFLSNSIKQSLSRQILASNDVVDSLAAYLNSQAEKEEAVFLSFTDDILRRHPHIEAVHYYTYRHDTVPTLNLVFMNTRDEGGDPSTHKNLYPLGPYRHMVDMAMASKGIVLAPLEHPKKREYWLFKILSPDQGIASIKDSYGAVSILISSEKTFDNLDIYKGVAFSLYSDSHSTLGRQVLFSTDNDAKQTEGSWKVKTLVEEFFLQLSAYSIRLMIQKDVYLSELDYHLVLVAGLLGAGILLLVFALSRVRESQARELISRNQIIERQVQAQTKELAIARDEALKASQFKSKFLASMSHEIRTPLNAINGMAELLMETDLSAEQKKYTDVFHKAGDALLSLVNDILDLSKIEAGQMVLETIPFDLVELLEGSVDIYALKAAEKDIDLTSYIDTRLHRHRLGDPSRLKQIILNLISNALKFTKKGEIIVAARLSRPFIEGRVLISVTDTGIGIPQDKLESIFSSFTQVDSSTTRQYGGTGLGLTISKNLLALMGGMIQVKSTEGKGSTFSVAVPLKQQNKMQAIDKNLAGKQIYILDGHRSSPRIVKALLSSKGAICKRIRENDLVSVLEKGGDASADLLLIDSQLAFAGEQKTMTVLLKHYAPAQISIMLDPWRLSQHTALARQFGLTQQLIKPLKCDELFSHVERVLLKKSCGPAVSEAGVDDSASPAVRAKHILLVEDNPDNRLLIKAYLKSMPYRIDEAENGKIAVDTFKAGDYDLVLMDVQMPVMDGHQATRLMREWEQVNHARPTPIISLTAHAIKEEIDKCLAAGCDTHISKPVKKATLLQIIENLE